MTVRIADVLQNKGAEVVTVGPGALVSDLVATLAERRIGALPVIDDGRLAGIVSERDVVLRLHSLGADVLDARVADVMTTDVVTCSPDDEIGSAAALMTDRRFRHLPVCAGDVLVGIVSIGDLVKARIDALEAEREHLQSYIAG
jgi:CBS domain-containing protein